MALALTVEKLDGLDPAVAALYSERDGKFILEVEGQEDVSGLKSALEAERKARKDFEKKYGALKDVDPEEYARLKAEAADRETEKLTKSGDIEKLQALRVKELDDLKAKYEGELADVKGQLRKHHLGGKVRDAALVAGVIPGDLEDVMMLTDRYFKLDGEGNIQVLDDRGEVTLKTVEEFFSKDFKERKPKFYSASGNSGGGTPPAGGTGGGPKGALQQLQDRLATAMKANDIPLAIVLTDQISALQQGGGA